MFLAPLALVKLLASVLFFIFMQTLVIFGNKYEFKEVHFLLLFSVSNSSSTVTAQDVLYPKGRKLFYLGRN